MTEVDTLIRDLEATTKGSRELDASIFIEITLGVKEAGRIDRQDGLVGWWPKDGPYQSAEEVPHYTTSLDAALTLVPEGAGWNVWHYTDGYAALVGKRCEKSIGNGVEGWSDTTPALAFCIAILKARKVINQEITK